MLFPQGPAHRAQITVAFPASESTLLPARFLMAPWNYLCPPVSLPTSQLLRAETRPSVLLLVLRPELAPLMSGTRPTEMNLWPELLVDAQPPQATQWTPARAL